MHLVSYAVLAAPRGWSVFLVDYCPNMGRFLAKIRAILG